MLTPAQRTIYQQHRTAAHPVPARLALALARTGCAMPGNAWATQAQLVARAVRGFGTKAAAKRNPAPRARWHAAYHAARKQAHRPVMVTGNPF